MFVRKKKNKSGSVTVEVLRKDRGKRSNVVVSIIGTAKDSAEIEVLCNKAFLFREDAVQGYALMDQPVELAFISVAAMNRPDLVAEEEISPDLVPAIKHKIRTMLRIGIKHSHDSLVLGASGCGAFRNPPKHMARLFHEVFEEDEFKNAFSKVVFAIINDHNSGHSHNPQGNFLPFVREFTHGGNTSKKLTSVQ